MSEEEALDTRINCDKHPEFILEMDEDCPVCIQEEFGNLLNHEGTY